MIAFTPNVPVSAAKPTIGSTRFATPLTAHPARKTGAPTMLLRTALVKPSGTGMVQTFSGFGAVIAKADSYMASCVRKQYIQTTNPFGTYGTQCTEGSVKHAAEVSRVRSLNADFRLRQSSTSKGTFDLYENRKHAIVNSHGCHHEETQFCDYKDVSASFNVGKSEALGTCFRYGSPETVEEAAMLRYMDIQQKISVNPTGVYNTACNEGAAKGQAEDIRVAALNTAFRQGQKSAIRIIDEKYQQKRNGYIMSHGCSYEEDLVTKFPSLGSCFRSKSYGY